MIVIYSDSKRYEQICKRNGWRKPEEVHVECKRDGKFTFHIDYLMVG